MGLQEGRVRGGGRTPAAVRRPPPGPGPAWPRSGGRGGYPKRRVSPTDGAGTLWAGVLGRERWGGWVDGIRSRESLRPGSGRGDRGEGPRTPSPRSIHAAEIGRLSLRAGHARRPCSHAARPMPDIWELGGGRAERPPPPGEGQARPSLRAGRGASCSFEQGKQSLTWPEAPGVSQDWEGRARPPPTPGPSLRPLPPRGGSGGRSLRLCRPGPLEVSWLRWGVVCV